jgi:Uma2 family endonuclease
MLDNCLETLAGTGLGPASWDLVEAAVTLGLEAAVVIQRDDNHRYTYEDLLDLPAGTGDRYEIIDGALLVTPSPSPRHQRTLRLLFTPVNEHVLRHALGEVFFAPLDVRFADGSVVEPDLIFLSNARSDRVKPKWIDGAPDLVAEILSPSTATTDRTKKRDAFAKHGVPFYWLVDAEARVLEELRLENGAYVVHARIEKDSIFKPALFPGLEIPLAPLWS